MPDGTKLGGSMIIRINGTQITQIERIYADFFYQRLSVKSASSAF